MVDRAENSGVRRRRFLTYMVAAPTLTVGAQLALSNKPAHAVVPSPPQTADLLDQGDAMVAASALTASQMVLEITPDNKVRFELPRVEMGQGITTAVAMMIAEELDTKLDTVVVQLSDARPELVFNQLTGGSTAVRTLWKPVRTMAAAARARLITAAAKRWNVPANTLTTKDTSVVSADGKNATFGSLSADASRVTVPAISGAPKQASQYKVIGKPTVRVDARDIVTGKAKYVLDLQVPGALPTVVARPPTINGTVASYDDSAARAMPGVVAVAKIPTGVAVAAKTFHEAMKARDALKVSWNSGPVDALSDADVQAQLGNAIPNFVAPEGLLAKTIDAEFEFAFASHAPMEVMAAIADVRSGRAEVWAPLQTPIVAQEQIAKELKLSVSAVKVHVTRAGGSFGRRLFFDNALEAAQISQAMGKPVKLMWTRNDDTRHARLRPASHHKIRASYGANEVLSLEHKVAEVELDTRHGLGEALTAGGAGLHNKTTAEAYFIYTQTVPYNFGAVAQTIVPVGLKFNIGSFRSVYSLNVRASEEILIDELAKQMGQDPVEFRMRFLKSKQVKDSLQKVAEAGKWGRPMPKGWAQGIGIHSELRSGVACLVEINATNPKQPRVTKAVIAADAGRVINPKGLQAQLTGGLVDAISIVLQAGVHIDKGKVREGSYSDYHWARQRHTPTDVAVHLLPASGEPGGAGELSIPAAAGAVANAYARATGTQPRRFPINF